MQACPEHPFLSKELVNEGRALFGPLCPAEGISVRSPETPPRPAGLPVRALAVLVALATALGAAFVLAPGPLAAGGSGGGLAGRRSLAEALREAFVGYWSPVNGSSRRAWRGWSATGSATTWSRR